MRSGSVNPPADVTAATEVIAILGSPIKQAMSPSIHNASFRQLGIDCVCIGADVLPEKVEAAVAGARAMGMAGLIVTMPDKAEVIKHLDGLSPAAELMGAVNIIVRESDRFIGHNTDGAGFMRAVAEADIDMAGQKMALIGTGGAGSAISTQAALDGVSELAVFNLVDDFFEPAGQRLAELAERTGARVKLYDLADSDELARQIADSRLVVDATKAGMAPLIDHSNIEAAWLRPGLAVADTVYVPRETKLLKLADQAGATPISGLGMLLWQAALAEKLWFDVDMSVPYIEELFFSS